MNENTILTVEGLSVTLDAVQVLRNVSFAVRQGEALAVIGPNGAGKTVLFRALLGLLPHEGVVRWRPDARIEYVPQRFSVERSAPITALEFCLLKSPGFWRPPAAFIRQVHDEIALMGLDRSVLKKNLGELSGGQTQRLLIAWALLRQPAALLLDEPTAGVDASFEDTIYSLVRRVQSERGTTVLLVSHDLSVVYRYAQNVLCLNTSVVCQGPPVEVLNPEGLAALYGETGYYRHDPKGEALNAVHSSFHASFWIAVLVGIASGSVGPFVLLRRMALVGDALSHVALPGIALALLYGADPFYGVIVFLTVAALLIFWLEGNSRIPTDAIVGLLFTASLAVGILIIPNADVIESLFGSFPVLSLPFLLGILSMAGVLSVLCFVLARRLLFRVVSPDLASVHGLGRKYDLALLLIFAMVVALGIKLVGTLLMGALTIIPAAVAKNVFRSMRGYMVASALLGGAISVGGMWIADAFRLLPGPCIILFGVALFLLSLVVGLKRTA